MPRVDEPAIEQSNVIGDLERFVLENDDLHQLEELVGTFNIFDALSIVRAEIRHSNFLAWLLDPNESHGLGDLFLRPLLMDIMRLAGADQRPFSPVELDGIDLGNVTVRREWRHIDLLIACDDPQLVVAIENKVDSSEHSNQLERYRSIVDKEWPSHPKMYVFLTASGDEPSEDAWTPYSYADMHTCLVRTRRRNDATIGGDVAAFIDHYIHLIGSRFMDDPQIKELCERIYKQHRQAIDLIIEHAAKPGGELLQTIREILEEQSDRWHIFNETGRIVAFVPKPWLEVLPNISARRSFDKRFWLYTYYGCPDTSVNHRWVVQQVTNEPLRQQIVDALLKRSEFGIKRTKKGLLRPKWNSLGKKRLAQWEEDDEVPAEEVVAKVRAHLDDLWTRLQGSAEVIKEAANSG